MFLTPSLVSLVPQPTSWSMCSSAELEEVDRPLTWLQPLGKNSDHDLPQLLEARGCRKGSRQGLRQASCNRAEDCSLAFLGLASSLFVSLAPPWSFLASSERLLLWSLVPKQPLATAQPAVHLPCHFALCSSADSPQLPLQQLTYHPPPF